jgi:hypothetical protein
MSRIEEDGPSDTGTDEGGEDELTGEGNRTADRRYRASTREFIAEGKVAHAADEARRALDNEDEREELERAERAGRARAKEHDPELGEP